MTNIFPSCKTCMLSASGECGSWVPCEDYKPAPFISDAKKSSWPKFGGATAIAKRQAKKHIEDGDPTLHSQGSNNKQYYYYMKG